MIPRNTTYNIISHDKIIQLHYSAAPKITDKNP